MSDYGVANPVTGEIKFEGEVPQPNSIYANDPGIAMQKANADHSHALNVGGVETPWWNLPLGPFCANYGGPNPTRSAQYTRVGNVGMIRGVVAFMASALPVQIGIVPTGFRTVVREMGVAWGQGGAYEVDLWTDGQLVLAGGPMASPGWLTVGSPYFIYVID